MKKLFLLLLIGSFGAVAWGQTHSPPPDVPGREVGLTAEHFFFSGMASRQLIYSGNVCVTNSQGSLTSERLTIDLPPEDSKDSRPTNVVAETNVVINYIKDGDTNHITCDKMINLYSVANSVTNDTFTFTGHARMSNSKGWMTGEPLVYDNVKGQFSGTGIKSQFIVPSSMNGGTNAGTDKATPPLNLFK